MCCFWGCLRPLCGSRPTRPLGVGLLSGYIVSLTGEWLSLFFGVLLILVVLVVLARGLHPVSFPNLEVKPFCADGTATGGLWESRALPTVSLSEWTGECWPVCGLVFPGFLFFGGGGVDPSGVGAPTAFFVCVVWFVFGGCGVTPRFLCVYGVLAVKGSQRHAYG